MTQFLTKLASGLLTLALVASFVPAAVFAQDVPAVDAETPEVIADLNITPASEEEVDETPAVEESSTTSEGNNGDQTTFSTSSVVEPAAVSVTYQVTGGDINELQQTINNASLGDTVQVSGSYTGNLVIGTGVTVVEMQGETASITGQVTISASNASFSGFKVTNPNGSNGILINSASNVTVSGNTITQIGSLLTEGSAQAIYVVGTTAMSNIVVSGNTISTVGNVDLKYSASVGGTSAKGIYIGDSNQTSAITGLEISNNSISNIKASIAAWNTGRGAYGILINRGGISGSTEATITGNTISDLEGLWAHGIGLEANTPNTVLSENTISDLTDHKDGTDAHAIFFEKNGSKTTVEIDGSVLGSLDEVVVNPAWIGYANNPVVTHNGKGYIFGVNATTTVKSGLDAVNVAGTVYVYPGNYNLIKDDVTVVSGQSGWYLAITKNGVTLQGVDAGGQNVTNSENVAANIYSTQETANGSWSTQNLITVFANDVSIRGLGIMNKISPNKGIEILGDNFTAEYNKFTPVPVSLFGNAANYNGSDLTKYGSGLYFNNNGTTDSRTATIKGNLFENSGVTFDSFGANWTVAVTGNTFDGNKSWASNGSTTYYAAIGATTWANPPALDFSGSNINVNENKFVNMVEGQTIFRTKAGMTGVFEASRNWWGSEVESIIQGLVSAQTTYTPWYVDAEMTRLNTDPVPSSGGSSSRSGQSRSSSSNNTAVVAGASTGTVGQVLGASTYNFTGDLTIGSTGADVNALQAMLIASGHLSIATPTGYFGPLTQAALVKWQAARGIVPASGYFGPLTRAAVAASATPAMTDEARAALLVELLKQVADLQEKLNEMIADES